ncbi:MAG TPA: hypothetical protein VF046_05540 [Gemmatimonadales bacterium]
MTARTAVLGVAVLGGLACSERPARAADDAVPTVPDSLATTVGDSTEIWFTLARPDSGGTGACTERAIEIRRGSSRTPVPLLYTGSAPEVVNDSTLRARLWNRCEAGDTYMVNLRTGQPTREQR